MTMIRRFFVAAMMAGLAVLLTAPATAGKAKTVVEVFKQISKRIPKHIDIDDVVGTGVRVGSEAAEKLREGTENDDSAKPTQPIPPIRKPCSPFWRNVPDDATNPPPRSCKRRQKQQR